MAASFAFAEILVVAAVGLGISIFLERFLLPKPCLQRPVPVWGLHCCLWLVVYALLVLLMARPFCSMVATNAVFLTLVLVNNAKLKALREPFLFQDYDYFLDTLRFPRLFLPFLGLKSFCLAALFFVLALGGLWAETPPSPRWSFTGQAGAVLLILACSLTFLWRVRRTPPAITLVPEEDIRNLGLLAYLLVYGVASRELPRATSPFAALLSENSERPTDNSSHQVCTPSSPLPHLIAIQSESFFDARTLFDGIRPQVLQTFDQFQAEAALHGPLTVPAWGANTVRTECSFLTGISAHDLGIHHFNPYQTILRGWSVASLPKFLQQLGYHTVCVHPYWARFYGRDRVMRHFGFDTFLDIKSFTKAEHAGAYVCDKEVATSLLQLLQEAKKPLFVFAITMENHGPLHMDPLREHNADHFYACPPQPKDCEELGAYLHHLANADAMLAQLHTTLCQANFPVSLCFYGDHVPIMSKVYSIFQEPAGDVPYFCWNNAAALATSQSPVPGQQKSHRQVPLPVHDLALRWLEQAHLL